MAKLAVKAAPSTALWFWEKAGIDRDDFQFLFPEFERIARDSERRVQESLQSARHGSRLVPLVRTAQHLDLRRPPSPEKVEDYIPMPEYLVRSDGELFAVRVSTEFIRPLFSMGHILVVDPSQTNVEKLAGELVVARYAPNARTRVAAEHGRSGLPVPGYKWGKWPHIEEGLYVGWVGLYPPKSEARFTEVTVNSAVLDTLHPATGVLEFSIPIAVLDTDIHGRSATMLEPEAELFGRVVCTIAIGSTSTSRESEVEKG